MTANSSASDGDGRLFSLVYASTATEPFSDAALEALLREARRANAETGITGLLLYRGGRFIQFIEGRERDVRALFEAIRRDPRHVSPRILDDGPAERREFASWTMAYQPVSEPVGPPPEGFRSTFDDLDDVSDPDHVIRATRELSMWFRVRSGDARRSGGGVR